MTTKTKSYIVLSQSEYYGPSTGKWTPQINGDGRIAVFSSYDEARASVAGPLYLGHNEYSRTYRIHTVRSGATLADLEQDYQYGKLISGGHIVSKGRNL